MQRKSNSQVTVAYEHIRDQIIGYILLPESPVSDNQFAKELGMSRAPIREAILLLQMDGLVQISEDGKVRVSPISFSDISDILCVRFALESEAICQIALSGWLSNKQENELSDLQVRLSDSAYTEDMTDHYKLDDMFHQKLAEFSNSPRICDILGRMRLQMQRARWLNLANPGRHTASAMEHRRILDAIIAHDEVLAISMLSEHFNNSKAAFQAILNDKKIQTLSIVINNFCASHKE